ncbi:MAG: Asp23/Gls24 family envelope stress response protein [Christensenellaceae bacterium]|jgi:hypothetical protein|nr:Asp23/Gls24 family envelope stress response protein [Christensenellaceae bacterium]
MSENNEVSYIEETTNKTGTISYANDVIAIIAGLAATEIAGISGMSGGITSGIAEMLGRKNLTKGVKVEVGTEETAIDLNVIVDYGVQIHKVAFDVQENVKKAVETMTGLHVVEVNVYVQGVNVAQEPKDVPRLK